MSTNEQTNQPVKKSPFTILVRPKTEEDLVIPERKLEDKRLLALGEIKHNGEVIEKGTIFKMDDKELYEHLLRYSSIKEVR